MPGHNNRSNENIGWRFGIAIDGSRKQVQCKFCNKVIRGGITRLKQHLAHKTGDVAPCLDVSAEVKRDMMKLLQDYKEKKRQKTRIARDLKDEITRSFHHNDYVDDEEEDAQLAHARYQSLEQHRFEHDQQVYRASRGAYHDEGGSSRLPSVPQMRRSATVRETSSRGSRDIAYECQTPLLDLELLRYFFNPQYMYRQSQDWEDREVRTGVQNVIMRLEPDLDKQIKAMRQGHLSPSSSHGGRRDGGDGGNGGANEMGASYSSRQSTDYFTNRGRGVTVEDDRGSRRSPDKQPREPTQTYRRVRKGKEPVQPHGYPTDAMYGYAGFQEVPSSFTGSGLFASSGGYDTYGDDIEITLRSSTKGLLITGIIIIISLPFIAVIQLQVSNLGWIQQRHQSSTHNKSHMVLIRIMMTPTRILSIIHFGGDKFSCIMDFKYEFVSNVQ
ncbi:hypothetical protein Cgig2_001101 [Carnegiea gigantea]|uniref:BED-type domain-containing protein n=1 Tax=Carnegiea gigantea TaxID=171969 RepID=A0A9Q1Q860_9CARY|nr:hypothetical protein Cgig2_001101 [Carnegiea gigantea]